MKSKDEQEDQLLKDFFKRSEIRPTIDITEQVMQRIDASSEVFEYRPIISRKMWVGLISAFLLLITFLAFQTGEITYQAPVLFEDFNSFITKLSASLDFKISLPELPKIPSTWTMVLVAMNVIGVYLIISYRWSRGMFK